MKCYILMGSPRKNGNTAALLKPFQKELSALGVETEVTWLYDRSIEPCIGCRACQDDWSGFGCIHRDDVQNIADRILESDLLILATPIYSWYCTSPMKALLDRLVYGMNKFYGREKGPALWAGKKVALLTTCGYHPEKGADLWEDGMKRYCKHSELEYLGMLAERDLGSRTVFLDQGKEERARQFAQALVSRMG